MIFFTPIIMYHVFWTVLFKEMGLDLEDYFPTKSFVSNITACCG